MSDWWNAFFLLPHFKCFNLMIQNANGINNFGLMWINFKETNSDFLLARFQNTSCFFQATFTLSVQNAHSTTKSNRIQYFCIFYWRENRFSSYRIRIARWKPWKIARKNLKINLKTIHQKGLIKNLFNLFSCVCNSWTFCANTFNNYEMNYEEESKSESRTFGWVILKMKIECYCSIGT